MKKSQRSQRLMWKIFLFMLGFCALLLAILWLFETVFLSEMYKSIRKDEIARAIILIEKNIDNPDLGQILKTLSEDQEIIVTPAHDFAPPDRPGGGDKPPMRETITEKRDFIASDGRTISLVFYAIISPVNATISTIKVQLVYVTGIMLVLSIILSFIIAKTVSKPIEKLNEGAKVLAAGNYSVHFSGKGYREIHELSDTLNTTASELSKVEGLRRELLANVSHDLRTPLSLIYSYSERMHDFSNEITPEQTQVIMDETTRLTSLVNDMLDISKFENGVQKLNPARFNLYDVLNPIVQRMNTLLDKEGYKIEFDCKREIIVIADRVKLEQAFYNLLTNAINYTGDSKKVSVWVENVKNGVRFNIKDYGDGIEAKNIPFIWDRYYKIDKGHKRALVGTGLGLSIVKKIVEMHFGEYGVESQVGNGSTFWFILPASGADMVL